MAVFKPSTFLVFAVAVNFARAHVAYLGGPNHLHQVQGIYVKPSSDGTTGDLYVAATEDSGVKSPWLSEQPINFLPHQVAFSSSLPDEVVIANQKRAVIASPPIKYSYGVPVSSEGAVANAVPAAVSYPYTIPAAATPVVATEGTESTDAAAVPAQFPYYQYPYHLYYQQMMSAFANALNNAAAKESSSGETAEEGSGSTTATTSTATPQAPVWPYSYPVQYVMVDPSAWAKAQAAATTTQATSTTEATPAASNEIS